MTEEELQQLALAFEQADNGPLSNFLGVRLNDEEWNRLVFLSGISNQSMSTLVRVAIMHSLPSCEELKKYYKTDVLQVQP